MLISRAGSLGQSLNSSSQKPSKNRLRKSLEGFMRRLSGSRDTQVWSQEDMIWSQEDMALSHEDMVLSCERYGIVS